MSTFNKCLSEGGCCTGALKAYKNSLDLHRQVAAEQGAQQNGNAQPAQASIPARLLNNAAVVFLACGKQREALGLVIEATQVGIVPTLGSCCPEVLDHSTLSEQRSVSFCMP